MKVHCPRLVTMTSENAQLENAYVLHRRLWRETSIIASCITPTYGLVECVAKGARRPKSPLAGILHPFTPLKISFKGRAGSLKTLTNAEWVQMGWNFKGLPLLSAMYVNELLMRLMPTSDVRLGRLYSEYETTLQGLYENKEPHWNLRSFEKALLDEMGFALDFKADALDGPIRAEALYTFDISDGIIKIAHYSGDNPKSGIPGSVILALGAGTIEKQHLPAAKKLLQAAIQIHLGMIGTSSHRLLKKLHQENL